MHLIGSNDRLGETNEQRDANDHCDDRGELAEGARERDIAEAGRRHRRNREIQCIDEADQTVLMVEEGRVDKARNHEQEDEEVQAGTRHIPISRAPGTRQEYIEERAVTDRPKTHGSQEGEVEQFVREQQCREDRKVDPGHGALQKGR